MAKTGNVYILRDIAGTKVRTGKAEIELRNGDIVEITDKIDGVYALKAPTASTKRFGIVYNADVVLEGNYRGLSDDPRDVKFEAGTIVNFYIPEKEDEVAITVAEGYSKGVSKVLVPTVDKTGYTAKATAGTEGLVYSITGEKFISIGNERVRSIEAVCVLA